MFIIDGAQSSSSSNTIVTHPDFRMIVLANRPGFPFLGNDFFGSLGKKLSHLLTEVIVVDYKCLKFYFKLDKLRQKEQRSFSPGPIIFSVF